MYTQVVLSDFVLLLFNTVFRRALIAIRLFVFVHVPAIYQYTCSMSIYACKDTRTIVIDPTLLRFIYKFEYKFEQE